MPQPMYLIFSSEQCVFIYDQYLLIQSASQFQCAKLNVCSMTELLAGLMSFSFSRNDHPAIPISGVD